MSSNELPFVIGAGLGRTGTHSLQAALMALGYNKPFHMKEILEGHVPADSWFRLASHERQTGQKNKTMALETAQVVIDQGYTATTDYPTCVLYEEFLELRPDAKVILTIRSDAAGWKQSVLDTIGIITIPMFKLPFTLSPFFRGFSETLTPWLWERTGGIAKLGQMDVPKESLLDYQDTLENAYEQWIETVKRQVPPEKLLVHHPKDGYEPICELLGVTECPKTKYPHIGDTEQVKQLIRVFEVATIAFWPVIVAVVLLLGFAGKKMVYGKNKVTAKKKR